jgi:hypothetical protein
MVMLHLRRQVVIIITEAELLTGFYLHMTRAVSWEENKWVIFQGAS